jgi:hypothetical protein
LQGEPPSFAPLFGRTALLNASCLEYAGGNERMTQNTAALDARFEKWILFGSDQMYWIASDHRGAESPAAVAIQ